MTLPGLGGSLRAVGDIGSHWLDLAGFVGGRRIEAVTADLTTVLPTRLRPLSTSTGTFSEAAAGPTEPNTIHTEDIAGVLIRFEGGAPTYRTRLPNVRRWPRASRGCRRHRQERS